MICELRLLQMLTEILEDVIAYETFDKHRTRRCCHFRQENCCHFDMLQLGLLSSKKNDEELQLETVAPTLTVLDVQPHFYCSTSSLPDLPGKQRREIGYFPPMDVALSVSRPSRHNNIIVASVCHQLEFSINHCFCYSLKSKPKSRYHPHHYY